MMRPNSAKFNIQELTFCRNCSQFFSYINFADNFNFWGKIIKLV